MAITAAISSWTSAVVSSIRRMLPPSNEILYLSSERGVGFVSFFPRMSKVEPWPEEHVIGWEVLLYKSTRVCTCGQTIDMAANSATLNLLPMMRLVLRGNATYADPSTDNSAAYFDSLRSTVIALKASCAVSLAIASHAQVRMPGVTAETIVNPSA